MQNMLFLEVSLNLMLLQNHNSFGQSYKYVIVIINAPVESQVPALP